VKTTAKRLPAAPIALAATLLAALLVLLSPTSASAHDSLVSSSPAADGTVETLPSELTLTFSAKLIDGEGATEVVVTDQDGTPVTDGPATVDGAIVTQPLTGSGPAGEYHVIWKVVSSDGHPTSGEFGFTVTVGDTATTTPTPSAAPTSAAPTSEPTPSAEADTTQEPSDPGASSGASAWIWALSIGGVLAIVALMVWYSMRGRKDGSAPDSDAPSER
jgi:methionine-rich copper-binding protein CopC